MPSQHLQVRKVLSVQGGTPLVVTTVLVKTARSPNHFTKGQLIGYPGSQPRCGNLAHLEIAVFAVLPFAKNLAKRSAPKARRQNHQTCSSGVVVQRPVIEIASDQLRQSNHCCVSRTTNVPQGANSRKGAGMHGPLWRCRRRRRERERER